MSNVCVGSLLAKKYLNAVKQAKLHEEELELINESLPIALVNTWKAMITTWESDRGSPNPYYTPVKSTSMNVPDRASLTFGCRSLRNRGKATPYT